ncbi:MAG: hypothetical protein EOO62_21670, partial [Hymenobacter sp.]
RPLTEAQKEYAANDVLYLFELTDRLAARLQQQGRQAVGQLKQVQHIVSGVFLLGLGKRALQPVRFLLALVYLKAQLARNEAAQRDVVVFESQ